MFESIPLSQPSFQGNEWTYLKACLDTGWVSGAGPMIKKFEEAVQAYTGSTYAIACSSGTAALQVSLQLAGVRPGDLVFVPNLTFIASANAVRYLGAEPILVEVDPETWQMRRELVASFLEKQCVHSADGWIHRAERRRVSAVLLVHLLGFMGNMGAWQGFSAQYQLPLVEDAAEALGSWFGNRHAGTISPLGCLSFNGNKLITSGGGGMILTSREDFAEKARHLINQAKVAGQEYYHDQVGYNFRLSNLQAAVGLAQMEQLPLVLARQRFLFDRYRSELDGVAIFPRALNEVQPNGWLPTGLFSNSQALGSYLSQHQIGNRPLWIPLHQLPPYQSVRYLKGEKETSVDLHQRGLSLPAYAGLPDEHQHRILQIIRQFYQGK